MASPQTPEDVLARRREVMLAHDPDGFAALFAPDGVLEIPFAPSRVEGRDAIRRLAEGMKASPMRFSDLETVAVHRTSDPEVVVVETVTHGTAAEGAEPFAIPSCQVFRIRDGQIVLFRDYAGPVPH